MKCLSCNGVSPEESKFCQFCGASNFVTNQAEAQHSLAAGAVPPVQNEGGKVAEFFDSILKIKKLPVNKFRWRPFFFNVSYLAGYGNTKEANRTIGILLGGYVLVWLFVFIQQIELARIFFYATAIFGLYYCYLIGTRIDVLVSRAKAFNWPVAIGYGVMYSVASLVLTRSL